MPPKPSPISKSQQPETMAEAGSEPSTPVLDMGRKIVYCGICTLPPEYCEFGGTKAKCTEWLRQHHRDLYDELATHGPGDAKETESTLSAEALDRVEKDTKKKERKAEAAEQKEADRRAKSTVVIKRVERSKKKSNTSVVGLEQFGLDLKKLAKDMAKKFATGASTNKLAGGGEEIVVQGDLTDQVKDFILQKHGDIVPAKNVVIE